MSSKRNSTPEADSQAHTLGLHPERPEPFFWVEEAKDLARSATVSDSKGTHICQRRADVGHPPFLPGKCHWARHSVLLLVIMIAALPVLAQMVTDPKISAQTLPPDLGNVSIEQKLNAQVPLDLSFRDEFGQTVKLSDYFVPGRPVILALVYYDCPMLCTEVLNGLATSLRILKFDPGKEYEVLSVSFDPKEKPELALAKKTAYLRRLGRSGAQNGWHFLTGDEPSIKALTEAVGFHYAWDPRMQQYAHATSIEILTPQGKIAQYYYGIEYSPKDLRLGLVEASQNKIGTVVDQLLLFCYHYDPRTGRYGAIVTRILRIAGAATILILGSFLLLMFRRERKRSPFPALRSPLPERMGGDLQERNTENGERKTENERQEARRA
jgi:protein SCO1/2